MPVGSPGASGVVGIARVGGLGVHGGAVLPRQGSAEPVLCLAELEATNRLAQEANRGGERSAVRLESDPGGARGGDINLEGGEHREFKFKTWDVWEIGPRLSESGTEERALQTQPLIFCITSIFTKVSLAPAKHKFPYEPGFICGCITISFSSVRRLSGG